MTRTISPWRPPKSDGLPPTQRMDDGELISQQRAWNLPWAEFASCRNHPVYDPDDWFPVSKDPEDAAGPIDVCRNECPVQDLCLAAAMRSSQLGGIWGGYTEDERRNIQRRAYNRHRRDTLKDKSA